MGIDILFYSNISTLCMFGYFCNFVGILTVFCPYFSIKCLVLEQKPR